MLNDNVLREHEFRDSVEDIIDIAIKYHDSRDLRSNVLKSLNEFRSKFTSFELIDAIETIWEGSNPKLYNGSYYNSVKSKLDEFLKNNGYIKKIYESNERD